MSKPVSLFFWVCICFLAACAPQADPAATVESYLQALVDKDQARYAALICPDWELDAMIEFDAFGAVEASLDGVECTQSGSDGDADLVECAGSILAIYRGEDNRVIDLEGVVYRVVSDAGEWRVCGYE